MAYKILMVSLAIAFYVGITLGMVAVIEKGKKTKFSIRRDIICYSLAGCAFVICLVWIAWILKPS